MSASDNNQARVTLTREINGQVIDHTCYIPIQHAIRGHLIEIKIASFWDGPWEVKDVHPETYLLDASVRSYEKPVV